MATKGPKNPKPPKGPKQTVTNRKGKILYGTIG